ncbi:MAG: NADPH:quinone oxidoreductase family protein [Alphaproteobacteria bacterium]|jgi:NADPH2:quinone reductase|nr:NADPH:quinone oxidoreductase family protein [Alphaproteobacteria bacterium]
MRAVICRQYGPPGGLEVGDIEAPEPKPGEVLVKVEAVGLGFVDALIVQGAYQIKTPPPFVPGGEFVGEIVACGEGVSAFGVGDRVISHCQVGALAERVAVSVTRCMAVPDGLDAEIAAGMMVSYCTGLHALADMGGMRSGETVLVLGAAGGVGAAAIDIAKCMGARVIAAASSEEKRDYCLARGADEVIDYGRDDWRDTLKLMTGPRGVDVVYDPVGGEFSEKAFRSIAVGGRFLVVGFAAGGIGSIPLNLPLLKRASIVGVNLGAHVTANPTETARFGEKLLGWWTAGKINPEATSVHDLGAVGQVLNDLLTRKSIGKPIIRL